MRIHLCAKSPQLRFHNGLLQPALMENRLRSLLLTIQFHEAPANVLRDIAQCRSFPGKEKSSMVEEGDRECKSISIAGDGDGNADVRLRLGDCAHQNEP